MNATMTVAHNQMKKYGIIIVVVTQILVSCCFLALFVSSLVVPDPLRSSYFDVTNALMVFFITTEFNLAAHLLFAKYNNISILLIPFLVYNVSSA
uniref:Uncharacterized protein n=1 Tax=Ditylenchus dipsaci TaxID=166011 RepID=A0A915EGL2_9BILA